MECWSDGVMGTEKQVHGSKVKRPDHKILNREIHLPGRRPLQAGGETREKDYK